MGNINKYFFDQSQDNSIILPEGASLEQAIALQEARKKKFTEEAVVTKEIEDAVEIPPITEVQRNFFVTKMKLKDSYGRTIPKTLPMEDLCQEIYLLAKEWNPDVNGNGMKWRILYEVLRKEELIAFDEGKANPRPKYKQFCEAVVQYVFPQSGSNYQNTIGKVSCSLEDLKGDDLNTQKRIEGKVAKIKQQNK